MADFLNTPISFTKDFKDGSDTDQIYSQLKSRGVSDQDLDHGYHQISYSTPGPNEVLIGQKDRRVQEQEVYEYLFEHYEDYHDIIQGLMGKPVPWILDDWDSKTDFDRELRAKVNGAIDAAKILLASQNVKEGTEEYQEKLSVTLFYFADFPDDLSFIKTNQDFLKKRTDELVKIGLSSFQKYLFEKGGLGVFLMKGDIPGEASAVEALQLRKGWCTKRSKILFAVLKQAGLNPVFVRSDRKEMLQRLRLSSQGGKPGYHVFLGLSLGNKIRYFDLSIFDSNVQAHHSYPLRLTQYAAIEMANRGLDKAHHSDNREALRLYQLGLRFDPKNGYLYYLLGNVLQQGETKDPAQAIEAYQKSIELEPGFTDTHFNLGNTYSLTGDFDASMRAYLGAIGVEPSFVAAYINMAALFERTGRPQCAIKVLQKVLQIDPENSPAKKSLQLFQKDRTIPSSSDPKIFKSDLIDGVCKLL